MRVGDKSIPDYRLPVLIDGVKTLYGKFGFGETDDETAARLLGHSTSRSGSYIKRRADLRAFGLITPRGAIKVTELGRKVSYPDNLKEEQEGLVEAVLKIDLWKLIYEKYTKKGLGLPSNFWIDIREWTGLPPEAAQNIVEKVEDSYLEDIKHIKPEREPEIEPEPKAIKTGEIGLTSSLTISEGVLARFTLKDVGYVDIKDDDTYQIAKAYFKALAKKLGIKEED